MIRNKKLYKEKLVQQTVHVETVVLMSRKDK